MAGLERGEQEADQTQRCVSDVYNYSKLWETSTFMD